MEETRWLALVQRLEPAARANPAAYRRRVITLALLGYVFIVVLLAALLALGVLVVLLALREAALLLKFLIPILALTWVVVRSLYVKLEPPAGLPLTHDDAPSLFRMIDEVRSAVSGPSVHHVLVGGDANAGVTQLPRAGGLFGSRNYLVLGLPYLVALSEDEFRAVVAHELGHLSRAHGRFGAFVYHVHATWSILLAGFEEHESMWTGFIRRFFLWYYPYFSAYAHPVVRAQELEADDASVSVAGREATAATLVTTVLVARWLSESYWPQIYARVVEEPAPPNVAFAPLTQEIAQAKESSDLAEWYRAALEIETDPTDSHPSLAERLAHLRVDPEGLLPLVRRATPASAASRYLGKAEGRLVAELDREWHEAVAPEWEAQHAEALREKGELERLELRDGLTAAELLRRAELTETFRGPDRALARYRDLVDTENDASARFEIGRLLLERGDEEGLQWLDDVIEDDSTVAVAACVLAQAYLHAHGREQEADEYGALAFDHAAALEEAETERSGVSVEDRLDPPGLPEELLERIREDVSEHDEVIGAYLVRKRTRHFDDVPLFVLGIVPKSYFRSVRKEDGGDGESLVARIASEVSLPGDFLVVLLRKGSALAICFEEVEGACVFERRPSTDRPAPAKV